MTIDQKFHPSGTIADGCLLLLPAAVQAQNLRNSAFNIQYNDEGIVSLRRTNDVADTEYIANGSSLGPVVARYRTSPQGEWRDISHLKLAGEPTGNKIQYRLGRPAQDPGGPERSQRLGRPFRALPPLTTAPWPPIGGGRGGGRRRSCRDRSHFPGWRRWRHALDPIRLPADRNGLGSRRLLGRRRRESGPRPGAGALRRRFPQAPRSWRILYKTAGNEWRPVQATTPYGNETAKFNAVKFAPVNTSAMRVEFEIAPNTEVGVTEWRVGPERTVVLPQDLTVSESFQFEGDQLNWTITLANNTAGDIEVGDLAVPTRMAEGTPGRRGDIYTQKLLRHSLIAGNGSWMFWARSNGVGPYLLMTTVGATSLEYFDNTGGLSARRRRPRWPGRLHALHSCHGQQRSRPQTGPRGWPRAALASPAHQPPPRAARFERQRSHLSIPLAVGPQLPGRPRRALCRQPIRHGGCHPE